MIERIRSEITEMLAVRDAFWRDVRAITGLQPRDIAQNLKAEGQKHLRLVVDQGLEQRDLPPKRARAKPARVIRNCE